MKRFKVVAEIGPNSITTMTVKAKDEKEAKKVFRESYSRAKFLNVEEITSEYM